METRAFSRKHYKELRSALTEKEIHEKSAQICERIITSSWYKKAEIILGYYPLGKEVAILPVLEHALSAGKTIVLPRTEKDGFMDFYKIESLDSDVAEGSFHIMEPHRECELYERPNFCKKEAVVALVPGVVFDEKGNRYGYGRGFYDRYFARFNDICRVGIAYDFQISKKSLEVSVTDIKMHRIVTEKKEIEA